MAPSDQWFLQSLLGSPCLSLGGLPDGQAEPDLVQGRIGDDTGQVSKEVTERVDGPTNGDNETHDVEGRLDSWGDSISTGCDSCTLTDEDFEEDEGPAGKTDGESKPWVDHLALTQVAEQQHDDGSDQQAVEHALSEIGLHGRQDQVELDHLQRH